MATGVGDAVNVPTSLGSDWRCRVVLTVVALLSCVLSKSKVDACAPKAAVAFKVSLGNALSPVIELGMGGVIGTVTTTEAPLASEVVVQSMVCVVPPFGFAVHA